MIIPLLINEAATPILQRTARQLPQISRPAVASAGQQRLVSGGT
jgi:hypothetical protein